MLRKKSGRAYNSFSMFEQDASIKMGTEKRKSSIASISIVWYRPVLPNELKHLGLGVVNKRKNWLTTGFDLPKG